MENYQNPLCKQYVQIFIYAIQKADFVFGKLRENVIGMLSDEIQRLGTVRTR